MPPSPPTNDAARRATTRRVLLVAGPGRSGTSAAAMVLSTLGYVVPRPGVSADPSNPRGFAESRWLVDFHDRLLKRSGVGVIDRRPGAGRVARQATNRQVRAEAGSWLGDHLDEAPWLVLKDPRLLWFLPFWCRTAQSVGAEVAVVTMLRHPAAVTRSRQTWYRAPLTNEEGLAAWLNGTLRTEVSTRGRHRALVTYDALVNDWANALRSLRTALGRAWIPEVDAGAAKAIAAVLDPSLRRSDTGWEVEPPADLLQLADTTWSAVSHLATDDGDVDVLETLDGCRRAYRAWYRARAAGDGWGT